MTAAAYRGSSGVLDRIERGTGRPKAYTLADGTKVPSVTTILKNREDAGGLIAWAMREGHRAEVLKDEAGVIGSLVHDYAESCIHGDALSRTLLARGVEELPVHSRDEARHASRAFDRWFSSARQRLEFRATEVALVSEKYRLGGTFDWLAWDRVAQCLVLGDFKTSKRFYADHVYQLGGYSLLLEDVRGTTVDAGMPVRLPKQSSKSGDSGPRQLSFGPKIMTEARTQFLRLYRAYLTDKRIDSFFGLKKGKR